MGCASTRQELSCEEQSILQQQDQLEFFKNSCKLIDFALRKYSYNGYINEHQWTDAGSLLEIKTISTPQCPKCSEFYNLFKDEGKLRFKEILVLGTLLSSGTPKQKAKLLFELEDPEDLGELSSSQVLDLIHLIVDISAQKIPSLVSDKISPPASEKAVQKYSQQLKEYAEQVTPNLLEIFMGGKNHDSVKKAVFVSYFGEEEAARLVSPYGVRNFLLKVGKETQKQNQLQIGTDNSTQGL